MLNKKGTVTISIERFKELEQCEEKYQQLSELNKNHTIYIRRSIFHSEVVKTNSDAVNFISESLKESKNKASDYNELIEKLKQMSIFQFYRWKNDK